MGEKPKQDSSPTSSADPDTASGRHIVPALSDALLAVVLLAFPTSFLLLPAHFSATTPTMADVAAEASMAFGALVGYVFVRKLGLPWLSIGWTLVATAMLVDLLDEFATTDAAANFLDIAQVLPQVIGYQLTALGLYSSYRALESRFHRARRAEESARRSQKDFQALFEEAPVGFWETDSGGVIVRANRAVRDLLGLNDGQIVGQAAAYLLRPAGGAPAPLTAPDGRANQFQVEVTHRDGTPRTINVHQNPIVGEASEVRGTRDALVDVTSETRLAEDQRHLERQLRQMQKIETVGTLAGGIAHDFNNLLSPIIGYVDMALEELPRESSLRSDLQEVGEAANRAKELVSQILTFSRNSDQEAQPVRIQDVAKDVTKLLRHTLPTTIEIRVQLDPLCPPVSGDSTKIHQVIMNLCTNAFHAMREHGGVLTVALAAFEVDEEFALYHAGLAPGPHIRLSISDTGCGIPSNAVDRIFDPFFTTKQPGEGTGLGLSVVHGIVTGYGGQVTVDSAVGEGSSFHVYLPSLATEGTGREEILPKPPMQLPDNRRRSEHIIVVDDDARVLKVTHLALERVGFSVTPFSKPEDALNRYIQDPSAVDLILTDQTMPAMTGLQLLASVRTVGSALPAILMTGYSEAVTEEALHEVGVSTVLMKPFNMRTLADTVTGCLENGGRKPARASPMVQGTPSS